MTYTIRASADGKVFAKLAQPQISKYQLLRRDGSEIPPTPDDEDQVLEVFGEGGFGVVVRAIDQLDLHRAIKIVDPDFLAATPAGATDPLKEEIVLVARQPLKHTVPIIDYGWAAGLTRTFRFYVMPFLDGLTLQRFFTRVLELNASEINESPAARSLVRDLLLHLIDDVLAGIVELSQAQVVHMDISLANVMVVTPPDVKLKQLDRLPEVCKAFLIDLGAAKRLDTGRQGKTHLIRHEYFFPHEIEQSLGLSYGDDGRPRILYENLRQFGSRIDLYCMARVLEFLLFNRHRRPNGPQPRFCHALSEAEEGAKEELWKRILDQDFDFIENVVDGMLEITQPRYRTPEDVRNRLQTLRLSSAVALHDSVLLTDKHQGIKVKAGRQLVRIAPPLDSVVDHPTFQRLKRIRQLSFLPEVYPAATHTRFTHSLQTYNLTKRYLQSLGRLTEFRSEFGRREVDEILTASLVHDVGQYPFAHAIEDLRKLGDRAELLLEKTKPDSWQKQVSELKPLQQVKHDQEMASKYLRTPELLSGTKLSIADHLERHGISVDNVLYLISKSAKDAAKPRALNIGRDLVSGVIDADRVSYLLYDSEQTGASYGLAVDVDGLVEGLRIRLDGPEDSGLAIDEPAVGAAEAVVAAVHWMYRNVYWHHANRALMAAVKHVVSNLLRSGAMSFENYVNKVFAYDDLQAAILLADTYDSFLDAAGKKAIAVNPLHPLVNRQRVGYKRIFVLGATMPVYDRPLTEREVEREVLYEKLTENITPAREASLLKGLAELPPWKAHVKDGDILLDIPLKPRLRWLSSDNAVSSATEAERGEREMKLWIRTRDNATKAGTGWIRFYQYSYLAHAYRLVEDVFARRVRVFVSRRLWEDIALGLGEDLQGRVEDFLADTTKDWPLPNPPPAKEEA